MKVFMNNDKIGELLKKVSFLIIGYEDGDLMAISDMMDILDEIETETGSFKYPVAIIRILKGFLNSIIHKEVINGFIDKFSYGIDLLSKLIDHIYNNNNDENPDELLKNDMEMYLSENESKANDTGHKEMKKSEKNISKTSENPGLIINSEPFKIFLVEADEKLLEAQELILDLEKKLSDKEIINKLFRIFHTIKGECGFLRLASLGELTHNLENLLDLVRSDEIENSQNIIDILFSGIDYSKSILKSLKEGNITVFNGITFDDLNESINLEIHRVKKNIGEILQDDGVLSETDVIKILQKQKESNFTKKFGEIAIEENFIKQEEITNSLDKQKKSDVTGEHIKDRSDTIIKVKSSQINFLVDMIGELLIAENQLDDRDKTVIQLKKISKEIQLAAMQLRTIKVKNLLINMKRLVRDLSKKLGKEIEMDLIGEDLEIDRNLVEMLEEPLVHLLRNAIHHGIETDKERKEKGKNPSGKIMLSAERRGNNVAISVRDDGKGLNEDRILKKALEKKLVSNERIQNLSKNEIFEFIFVPGFSTAESIDNVSGRGVGMDIVKNVVTSSRGKIDIKSEKDKFTEISLIFPLSMAIIDGMIVKIQDTHFVIPVNNIIESIQIDKQMVYKVQNDNNVINLRQQIIPIINLREFFEMDDVMKNEVLLAVITESREKQYAFLVNDIIAKKEIVIKPLNSKFKKLSGISSGTILPGGKIGFILDIDRIIETSCGNTQGEFVS